MSVKKVLCPICSTNIKDGASKCSVCRIELFKIVDGDVSDAYIRNYADFRGPDTAEPIKEYVYDKKRRLRQEEQRIEEERAKEAKETTATAQDQTLAETPSVATNEDTVQKKTVSSGKSQSKNKSRGNRKYGRLDESILYSDPDPIKFPSDNKILRVLFALLTIFTGCALVLAIKPSVFGEDIVAKLNILTRLYYIIAAVVSTTLWLLWIAYYFVRRFKKVDDFQPKAFKIIRRILTVGFIGSALYTFSIGIVLLVYKMLPELIGPYMNQNTLANIGTEYRNLKISAISCLVFLVGLFIYYAIDKVRVNSELREDYKCSWYHPLEFIVYLIKNMSAMCTIILTVAVVINLIWPNVLEMVLGNNYTAMLQCLYVALFSAVGVFMFSALVIYIGLCIEGTIYKKRKKK